MDYIPQRDLRSYIPIRFVTVNKSSSNIQYSNTIFYWPVRSRHMPRVYTLPKKKKGRKTNSIDN